MTIRKRLKAINGQRLRFMATVDRFGEKSAFRGAPMPTILLKDVRIAESKQVVTEHLWFTKGKSWEQCRKGDEVAFDARVTTYEKGYKGYREDVFAPVTTDYKLERPTNVVILCK